MIGHAAGHLSRCANAAQAKLGSSGALDNLASPRNPPAKPGLGRTPWQRRPLSVCLTHGAAGLLDAHLASRSWAGGLEGWETSGEAAVDIWEASDCVFEAAGLVCLMGGSRFRFGQHSKHVMLDWLGYSGW
jgi:hypothetical protein